MEKTSNDRRDEVEIPGDHLTEAQWWRLMFLSLTRAMCLADHMRDAWGDFHRAWELAGMEIPMGDGGDPDIVALEAMGARCLYGSLSEPPVPPRHG